MCGCEVDGAIPVHELSEPRVGLPLGDPVDDLGEIGFGIQPVELGALCRPTNYAERACFPQHSSQLACDRLGIVLSPLSTAEERMMAAEEYLSATRGDIRSYAQMTGCFRNRSA